MKASTDNNFTHRRGRGRGNRGRGRGYSGRGHQNHHQGGGHSYQNYHHEGGCGYQNHHQRGGRGYQNHYHQGRGRGSHRYGHYQSECQVNLDNKNGERTNFIENEEEVSLLMVCNAKEEKQKNLWYLDTGCSNHMSGDKSAFSVLDESFRDNVKFGDDFRVSVMGK